MARRFEYVETFHFGNPSNYAHYALSHSMAGCGNIDLDTAAATGYWVSVDMIPRAGYEDAISAASPPPSRIRRSTTINTFTVGAPNLPSTEIAKDWLSVDHDIVRTLRVDIPAAK